MKHAGKSSEEIARATNRSVASIKNKLSRMGLTNPKSNIAFTREATVELIRLWEAGHTDAEIGERMGRPKNSIIGKRHRMGLIRENENKPPAKTAPPRGRNPGGKKDFGVGKWTTSMVKFAAPQPRALSKNGRCQHIKGKPTADDTCKCLARTLEGSAYCEEHHDQCHIPGSAWGGGTDHTVEFLKRRSGSSRKADPPGAGALECAVDTQDDSRERIERTSSA